MKFEWGWCSLCKAMFVWCPKCNNNSCSGISGQVDGEKCDVCELAYQYYILAEKHNDIPYRSCAVEKLEPRTVKEQELINKIFNVDNNV